MLSNIITVVIYIIVGYAVWIGLTILVAKLLFIKPEHQEPESKKDI